jgi:hypothetical protein
MARVQIYPAEVQRLRQDLAFGLLNFGLAALEGALKRQAVVRGGHRSFMTGPKTKAGTPRVGGTLRRSMHAVVYLDGQPLLPKADENGQSTPDYPAGSGIVLYAGTNSGYGLYVDQGTSRMRARPMVIPAFLETKDEAPALIAAGMARRRGRG